MNRDLGSRSRGRPTREDPQAVGQMMVRPQAPSTQQLLPHGRASHVVSPVEATPSLVSESTRGAARGRRTVHDVARTRPQFVAQSKKGSSGAPVQLKTNYFRITTKPNWQISQYHVDFAPTIDITGARKALFRQHKNLFEGFIFDGAMLFTSTKLKDEVTELISIREQDQQQYKLTVKYTGQVTICEEMFLMILNNILRRGMEGLKLQLVGRNFFDAKAKIPIREYNLELWPGYVTSIRQHEHDILLCAEISTKVMRMETLHAVLQNCMSKDRDYKESFCKLVVGTVVLTDYSNKTYRVDEVDWDSSPSSTFDTRDGPVSYVNYYKNRYGIQIRDPRQPLIKSRSTERRVRGGEDNVIALIPELCRTTGLTDEMRNNFRLMKAVAEHTRVGPSQRVTRMIDFNKRLQSTPESMQILKEWNMNLDHDLVAVTGRELPPEPIVFGQREARGTIEADWTRALRDNKLHTVVHLKNWVLIAPKRSEREAKDFVRVLQDAIRSMGMEIAQPTLEILNNDKTEEVVRAIDTAIHQDPQLIMVVVSNNNAMRYAAIKKKCCVDRAIPTQVMVAKTITPKDGNPRSLMSVGTKVAIQLNCKLGAAPWFIKLPLGGLMVCGFDVTHDARDKRFSYGALVCSMDQRQSCKYFSAVSPHKDGEEISNTMAMNMTQALKVYRSEHNSLPAKIIFYRDGVGEGQLDSVMKHELENLKKTIGKHYDDMQQKLCLTYIIVNKRINTRIFKGTSNPPPGTIVDDVITLPERYDFYLVPQNVRQGTVSPVAFNVIEDTMLLPPDKLQMLTFKMCHLYYNWCGTVRVPAVCQYAHKLAFLVGTHLHQAPNHGLQNKLYFL